MLIACLSFSGCASREKARDQFSLEEYKRALALVENQPVPLPKNTPYDRDPDNKRTYLTSYQEGYRTGLTGYYITPLFQGEPRHPERVAGYYDGMSAGWQYWSTNNLGPGEHFYGERPSK
jgi:hypothetical protein